MKLKERQIIVDALIRAIDWEESLAQCWASGTPERARSEGKAAEFRKYLQEQYGVRKREPKGEMISLQEILRRTPTCELSKQVS